MSGSFSSVLGGLEGAAGSYLGGSAGGLSGGSSLLSGLGGSASDAFGTGSGSDQLTSMTGFGSTLSNIPGLSSLIGSLGKYTGLGSSGSSGSGGLTSGWGQLLANLLLIIIGFVILANSFKTPAIIKQTVNTAARAAGGAAKLLV